MPCGARLIFYHLGPGRGVPGSFAEATPIALPTGWGFGVEVLGSGHGGAPFQRLRSRDVLFSIFIGFIVILLIPIAVLLCVDLLWIIQIMEIKF